MHTNFLNAIAANPSVPGPRLIYADWCEEQGNMTLATHLREAANVQLPIDDDFDWRTLWTGEGMDSPTDWTDLDNKKVETPDIKSIDAVYLFHNGVNEEEDWRGLFHLTDGRFAYVFGGCDYTGWG